MPLVAFTVESARFSFSVAVQLAAFAFPLVSNLQKWPPYVADDPSPRTLPKYTASALPSRLKSDAIRSPAKLFFASVEETDVKSNTFVAAGVVVGLIKDAMSYTLTRRFWFDATFRASVGPEPI